MYSRDRKSYSVPHELLKLKLVAVQLFQILHAPRKAVDLDEECPRRGLFDGRGDDRGQSGGWVTQV